MRRLCRCVWVLLFLASVAAYGESVAVVDFECQGKGMDSDVGAAAADLFELALQQEGMDVYERRYVSWIIREKDLDASSLLDDFQVVRTVLPQVDILVRGEMRGAGAGKYALKLVAVSTQSGLSVMQQSLRGPFSEVLWEGARALKQCVESGEAPKGGAQRVVPGFTDSPEAAALYYKGISQLAAGHPGAAEELFTQAHSADPGFVLAAWWKMKTYDRIGLPAVAQEVRKEIAGNLVGNRFLQRFTGSGQTGSVVRIVALMYDPEQVEPIAEWVQTYYDAFEKNAAIRLLDVRSLEALGEEGDLALSGYVGVDSYLRSAVWALADDVVTFYAASEGGLVVTVYDSLSGGIKYEQSFPRQTAHDMACDPAAAMSAIANGRSDGFSPLRASDRHERKGPPFSRFVDRSAALDRLLQQWQEGDNRVDALFELAWWYERHRPGYAVALWKMLLEEIGPETPQADLMYSTALWKVRLYKRHGRYLMGDYFLPFLEKYPSSPAAILCRFSMACEIREGGDPAKGAEMLLALSDSIPAKLPKEVRTFDIESSYFYQVARALFENGQLVEAQQWIQKAKKSIQGKPADRRRLRCRLALGLNRNSKPSMVFALNEMAGDGYANYISECINALDQNINPAKVKKGVASLKQIARRADKATGARAYRLREEYLKRCLGATGEDLKAVSETQALKYLNWLVARSWRQDQRASLLALGERVRRHFRLGDSTRYRKAIGKYDEVLQSGWDDEAYCLRYGHPAYVAALYRKHMQTRWSLNDAMDIANKCVGVGELDRALTIYTNLMQGAKSKNAMRDAAIMASQCYALKGDNYAAADVLHQVLRGCKEEGLSVSDDRYARAVRDLRNLRIGTTYKESDPCWLFYNMVSTRYTVCSHWDPVFPVCSETNEIRDALYSIFRNYYWTFWEATPYRHYPKEEADAFVEKYGRSALPVLLAAYPRSQYGQDGSRFLTELIGRVATVEDVPTVLKQFKNNPELAKVAHNLDPAQTEEALLKYMPALRFQYRIFETLQEVVIDQRVVALYPVVFLNIANEGAWSYGLLQRMGVAMRECEDTNLIDMFRQALASLLSVGNDREKKWVGMGGNAAGVLNTAIEFGVVDGVRDLLEYSYLQITPKKRMEMIGPHLDIPQSGPPEQVIALLKDNISLLVWNENTKKFGWVNGNETKLYLGNWHGVATSEELLIAALCDQDAEAVKTLLPKISGAAEIRDQYGKSVMDLAVLSGRIDLVELLREYGVGVKAKDSLGSTPLNYAAMRGDVAMCRYLLECGSNINATDEFGYTPLHRAAMGGNRKLISLCLKHRADDALKNKDGFTALELAPVSVREWMIVQLKNGSERD